MNAVLDGQQRGVALIQAMLVVALATSLAVAMVSRQQFDIRRTGNLLQAGQADLYADGVEVWAMQLLRRDRTNGEVDDLNEDWATILPPIPVEGGSVAGHIEDLQGRFNLNALVVGGAPDAEAVAEFRRLLAALQGEHPELAGRLGPELAAALIDWLDGDLETTFPGGAEDDYYLGLEHPYRAANAPLVSPSELRLIKGVDADVYAVLRPHVTALPVVAAVNVNTATVPVLMGLVDGLGRVEAEALVEERPYDDVNGFLAQEALAGRQLRQAAVAVGSDHFLIVSQIQFGKLSRQRYSVVQRDTKGEGRILVRAEGSY